VRSRLFRRKKAPLELLEIEMTNRRKIAHGHINHERWVISYADFVTLLFAFFVVMFATANADKGKARAVAEAVKAALDPKANPHSKEIIKELLKTDKKITPETAKQTVAELTPSLNLLQDKLKDEIQRGEIELHMETRGLTVSFKQAALFDSGDAEIKPSALPSIGKVADAILKLPNQIRLEGHTDNVPIHNDHFRNNWELSSARSIAVLQLLTEQFNVPVKRLAVSGYADVAPVADNDTDTGRARNRRVDVIILSTLASKWEPDKSSAAQ
jgi:chemotaxis protein MotB